MICWWQFKNSFSKIIAYISQSLEAKQIFSKNLFSLFFYNTPLNLTYFTQKWQISATDY